MKCVLSVGNIVGQVSRGAVNRLCVYGVAYQQTNLVNTRLERGRATSQIVLSGMGSDCKLEVDTVACFNRNFSVESVAREINTGSVADAIVETTGLGVANLAN